MKITDCLIAEHSVIHAALGQMDRLTQHRQALPEIRTLCQFLEGLLKMHGDAEVNLAYVALDHVLANKGQMERLYQDHEELHQRFQQIVEARDITEARRLLRDLKIEINEHFAWEERSVFPIIEQELRDETLNELGNVWRQERQSISSDAIRSEPLIAASSPGA
jgi:hemerythrin-like domain-containing protein